MPGRIEPARRVAEGPYVKEEILWFSVVDGELEAIVARPHILPGHEDIALVVLLAREVHRKIRERDLDHLGLRGLAGPLVLHALEGNDVVLRRDPAMNRVPLKGEGG